MRERIARRLGNPLPYPLQNDYRRDLRPQELPAIKLTNSSLEAIVLPELGGRLWSLRDLEADRDLVFTNRRLQFANFGLTDAWFAGGVEWNLGSTGHSATTSRPVFVGSVPSRRGTASADLGLGAHPRSLLGRPADAPDRRLLLAFVRVRNPDPEAKPLYWWTTSRRRGTWRACLGPRRSSLADRIRRIHHERRHPLRRRPGHRCQLSAAVAASRGLLLPGPSRERPWIAAVQADGRGLVPSTAQLRGRKLFLWGAAAGGRHWQEWLCGPGRRYLEIQAGLATTQLEHLRLEGGAEISWAEAYAPIEAAPATVHGSWPDALTEVAELVARAVPDEALEEWHQWWRAEVADATPVQMAAGSGAGEAELIVRGEDPEGLPGTLFGHPTLDGFRQLVVLARTGQVHQDAAGAVVLVPPISDRWEPVLDRAADGWWSRLMYAIRCHARGELAEASATCGPTRSGRHPGRPAVWPCSPVPRAIRRAPRTCTPAPLLADLPAAARGSHRAVARCLPTGRPPGDDRRSTSPGCCARPAGPPAGTRLLADGQADAARAARSRDRGPRPSGGRDAG